MAVMFDRRAYAEMSTVDVPVGDAFAYWRELICATFVRLTAEPVGDGQFRGRIEHVPCGDVELSTVVANSQIVRRTRALIQRDNEEYLLSSIQLDGRLRIEQDGRIAVLSAGDMAFYDSTRPYSLQSDEPSSQLVIQVPKRELSICDTRRLTARTLGSGTPAVAVSAFLTFLRDAAQARCDAHGHTGPAYRWSARCGRVVRRQHGTGCSRSRRAGAAAGIGLPAPQLRRPVARRARGRPRVQCVSPFAIPSRRRRRCRSTIAAGPNSTR
jgi:AraC-binding-like domain